MKIISGERKPEVFGYTCWYTFESADDLESRRKALFDAGATKVFYDRRRCNAYRPASGKQIQMPQLSSLARMLIPGDEVLIESVDRLGEWECAFRFVCDKLKHARLRFLDVEALYGDEEPPCVWFASFLADKLTAMRERVRKEAIQSKTQTYWHGLGWKMKHNKLVGTQYKKMWVPCYVMRLLGARIVRMRDEFGKRWDHIAQRFNAEGLYFRDCSRYSCEPWNERTVRLFYMACRKRWPFPTKKKLRHHPVWGRKQTRRQQYEEAEAALPLPNPNAGRKIRKADVDFARKQVENLRNRLALTEQTLRKREAQFNANQSPPESDPPPPTSS